MSGQQLPSNASHYEYRPEDSDQILWHVTHALRHTTHDHTALEIACLGYIALLDRVDEFVADFGCEPQSISMWLMLRLAAIQELQEALIDEKDRSVNLRRLRQRVRNMRYDGQELEFYIEVLQNQRYEALFPSKADIVKQVLQQERRIKQAIEAAGGEEAYAQQVLQEYDAEGRPEVLIPRVLRPVDDEGYDLSGYDVPIVD